MTTRTRKDHSIHCGANRCLQVATYNVTAGSWRSIACRRHLGDIVARRVEAGTNDFTHGVVTVSPREVETP